MGMFMSEGVFFSTTWALVLVKQSPNRHRQAAFAHRNQSNTNEAGDLLQETQEGHLPMQGYDRK